MTYPNGRVLNYNYNSGVDDRISRLSSLSESAGTLESYSYLGLDTVIQRAQMYQGAAVATQSYIIAGGNTDGGDKYTGLDRFGRVVEQRWVNGSSVITDDFLYSYDQDSNALSRSNALNSSFTEQYGYDHLNRLTSFTRGSTTESWGLDALGNWSSLTNNGSTQTRSFNNQNQITAISGTPSTPAYDRNGNTIQDQNNQTFTYDAWNRLVKLVSGANTEVYSYDALGRRITAKLNSTAATDLYFSSAWQVLEEDVGGTMKNQYVWSPLYVDALVEGDLNGTRYYVQQDANWNVTAIVGTTGTVQERFVYDPYGQPSYYTAGWASTSNNGWIYQFQGGRYDSTSGLYNFRNRDMSPSLGRWMEQDPIGYIAGDSNLYAFTAANPVGVTDPIGLEPPSEELPGLHLGFRHNDDGSPYFDAPLGSQSAIDLSTLIKLGQDYRAGDLLALGYSLGGDAVLTNTWVATRMQLELINIGRENSKRRLYGNGYCDAFGYHRSFCLSCHD
jgi:RHS repeat-associated protein